MRMPVSVSALTAAELPRKKIVARLARNVL
jgi:hypothetical protein